jgi:hypothetical protein
MTGVTISLGTRVGVPNLSAERVPRRTPRGDSVRVAWGLVTFRTAVSAGDVVLPGGLPRFGWSVQARRIGGMGTSVGRDERCRRALRDHRL